MKIRYTEGHDTHEVEIDDSLEIIADNGQKLYQVDLCDDTALEVFSGVDSVVHQGKRYSFQLITKTENTNEVIIKREQYE